jgi:hypothetical protein
MMDGCVPGHDDGATRIPVGECRRGRRERGRFCGVDQVQVQVGVAWCFSFDGHSLKFSPVTKEHLH